MTPSLRVLDMGLGMQQALNKCWFLLATNVCLPICLCHGDMKAEDSAIFVCSWEHPNDLPGPIAQGVLRPYPRPALDYVCIRGPVVSEPGWAEGSEIQTETCRLLPTPRLQHTPRLLCLFSCSCLIRVDFSTSCSRDAPVSPLPTSCPGFHSCTG